MTSTFDPSETHIADLYQTRGEDFSKTVILRVFSDEQDELTTIEQRIRDNGDLAFIWDEAPVGMLFLDADSVVVASNKWFSGFIGYTGTELRGMSLRDLVAGVDFGADMIEFGRVLSGDSDSYRMHKMLSPKFGALMPCKWVLKRSPLHDEGTGMILFASVLPVDAFAAAGVNEVERAKVLQQALGGLILRTWKIWLPILFALIGLANLSKIIEALS